MGGTPGFDPAAMQAAKEAKAAEAKAAEEAAKATDPAANADAPVVPAQDTKPETAAEKKAREKAEADAKKAAEADAKATSKKVFFVNRKTHNLSTLVGNFLDGLFVAESEEVAETIRKTEDFQWGFVDEYTEKEYKAKKEKEAKEAEEKAAE